MYCRDCGKSISEDAKKCNSCGTLVGEGAKYCQICGHITSFKLHFCFFCGAKINNKISSGNITYKERETAVRNAKIPCTIAKWVAIISLCIGILTLIIAGIRPEPEGITYGSGVTTDYIHGWRNLNITYYGDETSVRNAKNYFDQNEVFGHLLVFSFFMFISAIIAFVGFKLYYKIEIKDFEEVKKCTVEHVETK